MTHRLEVALVGCGHMGAHHARVTGESARSRLAAVVDVDPDRARRFADRFGATASTTVPEHVDVAVIATPTTSHVAVAAPLLARGLWCLVEKPVAASAREADALRGGRVVVGHSERFNPAVRAFGPARPTHVEARRVTGPGTRGRDVDVLADLMIHDLDLLRWWGGGGPVAVDGATGVRGADGAWQRARAVLRVGSLTASLEASRDGAPERVIRVRAPGRVARLDLAAGRATDEAGPLAAPDPRDALEAQWDAFLDAVEGRAPAAVGLDDARAALDLADRIRQRLEAP